MSVPKFILIIQSSAQNDTVFLHRIRLSFHCYTSGYKIADIDTKLPMKLYFSQSGALMVNIPTLAINRKQYQIL